MKIITKEDFALGEGRRLVVRVYEVDKTPQFPGGIKFAFQYLFLKDEQWIEIARVDNYEHDAKQTGLHIHKLGLSKVEFKEMKFQEIRPFIIGLGDSIAKRIQLG